MLSKYVTIKTIGQKSNEKLIRKNVAEMRRFIRAYSMALSIDLPSTQPSRKGAPLCRWMYYLSRFEAVQSEAPSSERDMALRIVAEALYACCVELVVELQEAYE